MNFITRTLGWMLLIGMVGCKSTKTLPVVALELNKSEMLTLLNDTSRRSDMARFVGVGTMKSKSIDQSFRYDIRLKRDSIIWVDLSDPFLGLKVARVIILKDSAAFYNRLTSEYAAGSLSLIQNKIGLPLELKHLQSVLLGEAIRIPKKKETMEAVLDTPDAVLNYYPLFDPLFVEGAPFYEYRFSSGDPISLSQQRLSDVSRILTVVYHRMNGAVMPDKIALYLNGKDDASLILEHSQIEWDKDLKFNFSIPSDYERTKN